MFRHFFDGEQEIQVILARFERAAFRLGVRKGDSLRSPLLTFVYPKTLDFTGFLTIVSVRVS